MPVSSLPTPWIVAGALLVEGVVGWPRRLSHPVAWIGALIAVLERRWNKTEQPEGARRALGVVTVLTLIAVAGGAGWGVQALAAASPLWPGRCCWSAARRGWRRAACSTTSAPWLDR